jgi:hypothetical protein
MADEHMVAGNAASALRLLQPTAAAYRADGWSLLLTNSLQSLRECAGRLALAEVHREYSIELGMSPGPPPERAAVLSAALAALDVGEAGGGGACVATPSAARACAGFSAALGSVLSFHAALRFRAGLPLTLLSAAVELETGGSAQVVELAHFRSTADGWHIFSAELAVPESGAIHARALLLRANSSVFRLALRESSADADADVYAPADVLAPAAAHIARLGGLSGVVRCTAALAKPSAGLVVTPPSPPLLSGQLAPLGVTITCAAEALCSPVLRFSFGAGAAPAVFANGSCDVLQPAAEPGVLEWCCSDIASQSSVDLCMLLCFADEAPPQQLTVSLQSGAVSREVALALPPVCSPLSLSLVYMGALQEHTLLPASCRQPALTAAMPSVLAATLRASAALVLHAVELEAASGWSVQVRMDTRSACATTHADSPRTAHA